MSKGTIKRIIADRGFGFIDEEGGQGQDLFFHRNSVQGGKFEVMREGQEVEFDTTKGRDGRQQAENVRLVEAAE